MAEFIHGTKAAEFGPAHREDALCVKDCETCANKIFTLHTQFFTGEFKSKVGQQHGENSVCQSADCSFCVQSPKNVTCPGKDCKVESGRVRTGVLCCEIFQQHPGNLKCAELAGPVKRCGCKVHVKTWLLCSYSCLLSSKFAKAVPQEDRPTFEALFKQAKFSIPEMGPLLVHDSYKGPNVSDEVLLTCCGMCGKQNAPKICTGCKKARYCDAVCQKGAWKEHKPLCSPMTQEQIKEAEKKIAEAEAKAKVVAKLEEAD